MFDGWLGDDLLESFPCFILTERLANELERKVTGFSLDDVTVSTSDQFEDLYPGRVLPAFCWLKVSGQPLIDDFYLGPDHVLYVRE